MNIILFKIFRQNMADS